MVLSTFYQINVWEGDTMRANTYGYKRKNNAFRVAYWPDCQRIDKTPNLSTLVHGWAKERIDDLSLPARKVLAFLAALNRTGKTGYCGFAVAYGLLAPQIAAATWSKFSKRSMERAIHDLKQAGLVKVDPWLREGQYFRCGGRNVRMCGAGRVELSSGAVVVRRLAIVTLTDDALAMWEAGKGKPPKPQGGKPVRNAHRRTDPSPAKMAARSPEPEQIDKSIMLSDKSDLVSPSVSTTGTPQEGRPTRPPAPQATPSTVGHRASRPDLPSNPPAQADTGPQVASSEAPKPARDGAPPPCKGCTKPRPRDGGPSASSGSTARDLILACLWDMLANHSPRQADNLYSRAAFELDNPEPGATIPALDWPYYLGLFPGLTPKERQIKTLREILPALKKPVHFPHDQRKVIPARPSPKNDPKHIASALHPMLAGFVERMGLK